jgi:preprotein translocase subunit YajC
MLKQIFISDSFAQTAEAAAAPATSLTSFIPLILIFGIFYFLIIRPQSKKMKEHQALVNSLKNGNKVITSGGIVGVVKNVLTKENQVEIEIAEGVIVTILKNHVADLVKVESKTEGKVERKNKK